MADAGPPNSRFSIGLVGDWGYKADQRARLPALIDHMSGANLAFSVHDGDILGGTPCADDVYYSTRRLFDRFAHPLIYTPGDNEWTDCWRTGSQPNERLRFLRPIFFSAPHSLGQRTMPLERQAYHPYPENARWHLGGVTFATLHVVGSNDNLPYRERPGDPAEHEARKDAYLAWMQSTFDQAKARGSAGVMLFMQANPWDRPDGDHAGYQAFLRALAREATEWGRPVVLVHGDTHTFRHDHPLRGVDNFTRVETLGPQDFGWVRASVDPAAPGVFSFWTERPPRGRG